MKFDSIKFFLILSTGLLLNPFQTTAQCPREVAVNDYNNLYLPSAFTIAELNWTGSVATCTNGTISATAFTKNLQRINYYRKLVGGLTTNVTFEATKTAKAQAAALLQEANPPNLSHCTGVNGAPCDGWNCTSADGIEGSQSSNLGAGDWDFFNPIDQWMAEPGGGNTDVGHRRWILYSRAQEFGLGLTPNRSALFVFGNGGNPAVYNNYIAYPPNGYIPRGLVYPRWSFCIPGADFSNATVTVVDANTNNVALNIVARNGGFGDPALVWEPVGIVTNSDMDVKYTVTVANITGAAQTSYTYDVWIIPPVYPPNCPAGQNWNANNCQCEPATTCAITGITAGAQTPCDQNTNNFTQAVIVTYINPPIGGNLIVQGQAFPVTVSPQTVTLTSLPANGQQVNVTANFSIDPGCTFTQNNAFTAPAPCNMADCATVTLACGQAYNGNTNTGINTYGNYNNCVNWDETGPEIIHKITTTSAGDITATLTNLAGVDLDVFILSACDNAACVAFDDNIAVANNQAAGTYYIVVDGYQGEMGTYTLTVTANCTANCNNPPPVNGPIASGTYQIAGDMMSAGTVATASTVIFKASNSISLNNNFEVQGGATLEMSIENCGN